MINDVIYRIFMVLTTCVLVVVSPINCDVWGHVLEFYVGFLHLYMVVVYEPIGA